MTDIKRTIAASLETERRWLKSINAPVIRIPQDVASAVATRVVLSVLSKEDTKYLFEQMHFLRLISSVFNGKDAKKADKRGTTRTS